MADVTPGRLRLAHRLVWVWAVVYGAIAFYWQLAEAAEPGQQYADPGLPCFTVAWMFSSPAWLVLIVWHIHREET